MVSLNRNFNIEEVDTRLFNIGILKYQTIPQKIILYGGIITGIALNVILPYTAHTPTIVNTLIFLAIAGVGILFGGNYNQDMSLIKYLLYRMSKTSDFVEPGSTESVEYLKQNSIQIEAEERKKAMALMSRDPAASKRMLKMLITLLIVIFAGIGGLAVLFAWKTSQKPVETITHHTAKVETVELPGIPVIESVGREGWSL